MKRRRLVWSYLLVLLIFSSGCSTDENSAPSLFDSEDIENQTKNFVWDAMNIWYLWQEDVPQLSNELIFNTDQRNDLIFSYNSPEELFDALLYEADRFSWIVDNYIELDNSFQGRSESFGFEFGLVSSESTNELIGYIQYIVQGSNAELAGLRRGDIFNKVDGSIITRDNYTSLLLNRTNYTLGLVSLSENLELSALREVNLQASVIDENPILMHDVIEEGNSKIGYLVYNQFVNNNTAHRNLNNVFELFKNESVNELVLDLRYNLGGSLETTRILASMIHGSAKENQILASIVFNNNFSEFDSDIFYYEELPIDGSNSEHLNRLNLSRIFILTGTGTASASELLISGLQSEMEVILIGEKTVGKNLASRTLYDSPDTFFSSNSTSDVNPNHLYALQPIVARLVNKNVANDYERGIVPQHIIKEADYLYNLPPLGDSTEPLLAEAIHIIQNGSGRVAEQLNIQASGGLLINSRNLNQLLETTLIE